MMRVTMRVDGADTAADIDRPGESLLGTLRDRLGLTGTKNACEQGECGSCTVLLDGDPVCACLVATAQCEGREVRTVVGAVPRAVRDAFLTCGAVQCGFCTPGLLVTVADLLEREADPSDLRIREALAGNLCRCTGYEKIIEAVHVAATATAPSTEAASARPTDSTAAAPAIAATRTVDTPPTADSRSATDRSTDTPPTPESAPGPPVATTGTADMLRRPVPDPLPRTSRTADTPPAPESATGPPPATTRSGDSPPAVGTRTADLPPALVADTPPSTGPTGIAARSPAGESQ